MEEKRHFCEYCGKEIHGRTDKRFCNSDCKNNYYYETNKANILACNRTITALRANYRILCTLLSRGKYSADLYLLQDLGFKPAYITGHRRVRYGHDEYRCFDIVYCQTPSRIFNILKSSEPEKAARR